MSHIIEELINSIEIHKINPMVNFWMVRTKKGVFYDEFIDNEFVALGWNIVDKKTIEAINNDDIKEKKLKAEIEYKYKSKQGTQIYNKCIRFMKEMKDGDILMIPSGGNDKITFAVAGEYLEVDKLDYAKEVETIAKIDGNIDYGIEIQCPYKKRRKITILKTISGENLNINLYKALASYHGINEINKYANYILSSIYNIYYWENKINMVFSIEKDQEIGAIELASFMYNASSLINSLDTNINVSTKVNLNSPGDLILTLQQYSDSVVNLLNSPKTLLGILAVWFSVGGGKIGRLEIPNMINLIIKWRIHNKFEDSNEERDLERLLLEKDKLDRHYHEIKKSSLSLEINRDDVQNVINLDNYRFEKNED